MKISQLAILCHNTGRELCKSLGDDSQLKWDKTDKGTQNALTFAVGYRLDNADASNELNHNVWYARKRAAGWVHGEKDVEKKTHPHLVPYSELPPEKKARYQLVKAVVDICRPFMEDEPK